MSATLSVCMRNHNCERFIREAIQSVLRQSYTDWELVIVDDDSDDASRDLIRGFDDPRIRFFQNERRLGNVENLNRCMNLASGKYLTILDADDALLPHSLERRIAVMEADPAIGLVYAAVELIGEDGTALSTYRPFSENHVVRGDEEFRRLIRGNYIYWQTATFRRQDYNTLGGFSEKILYSSGWQMWLRLTLYCDKIAYIDEPMVQWRERTGSLTNSFAQSNQVGMEEYKIIEMVFANLPAEKGAFSALKARAVAALAATMQRRAFHKLIGGNSRLARQNLGLAVAVDPGVLADWKTYALFGATLLGPGARVLGRLPTPLVCALAKHEQAPSFFSGG